MKKRLALIIAFIVAAVLLASCGSSDCTSSGGYQVVDTVWKFDKAIIALPNGEIISGNIEKWRDFEDGDQLQIRIDGVWYLVHSSNAVLISYTYEQP